METHFTNKSYWFFFWLTQVHICSCHLQPFPSKLRFIQLTIQPARREQIIVHASFDKFFLDPCFRHCEGVLVLCPKQSPALY